jgi:hypothetical protein
MFFGWALVDTAKKSKKKQQRSSQSKANRKWEEPNSNEENTQNDRTGLSPVFNRY